MGGCAIIAILIGYPKIGRESKVAEQISGVPIRLVNSNQQE